MKKIDIDFFEYESEKYENSLDNVFKKVNGVFYTDSELARAIVKFLRLPKDASYIDPCCGTGSFLYELSKLGIKKIYGCDFDLSAVEICRELTCLDKIYKIDTLGRTGQEILSDIKVDKFDYVIGNPPYAPIAKDVNIKCDESFMSLVRESGSNLFVAAIYRAFELAKDDGIISFIVPKNLLHVSSYQRLRKVLLKEKSIISIIELGIHFKAVRGEQVVITFKNKYSENNNINFYKYNNGKIKFMSSAPQDYYENEIIVFTSNKERYIYDKLRTSYDGLEKVCSKAIHRGRNKNSEALKGKQIRKYGFKEKEIPKTGTQLFIQNIFAAEAGITACFGGSLIPSETITVVNLESIEIAKYILGLLSSRVCNYYLIRFLFNNSRLTIHTDAKYLNKIPIVLDEKKKNIVVELVEAIEKTKYMSKEWFLLNEQINNVVYEIYNIKSKDKKYIESEMRKISSAKWYEDYYNWE